MTPHTVAAIIVFHAVGVRVAGNIADMAGRSRRVQPLFLLILGNLRQDDAGRCKTNHDEYGSQAS